MEYYNNDHLMHYGVKGMKWGVRRTKKYEAKAKEYRSYAEDYDPKNYTVKLSSKERAKLQAKSDKYNTKANEMVAKAQKSYDKEYQKNFAKGYNNAADYANSTLIPQINSEYQKKYGKDWFGKASESEKQKYYDDYQNRFNNVLSMKMEELVGKRPE